MKCDKNNNTTNNKTASGPREYNDQLGENASEEYKSEKYANASKVTKDNKDLK